MKGDPVAAHDTFLPDRPFVVSRGEIPLSSALLDRSLEIRPFAGHPLLRAAASADAAMSWLKLRAGQECPTRSHGHHSLLIVLCGKAELVASSRRSIELGDVVTLPKGYQYRLVVADASGFEAILVMLGESPQESSLELTLEDLLQRNQQRLQEVMQNPYFLLLRNGSYESSLRRKRFRDHARVFADAFQAFLVTRQAMCHDDEYLGVFQQHLAEELGHNKLLQPSGDERRFDPLLQATSSWFAHQMLVLDNAGKAVVTLALETGGYHFHSLAEPAFAADEAAEYFHTHAEDDEQHQSMGIDLLRGLHPRTYARLREVLDDSWDMIDAFTRRLTELITLEGTSS
jgi:hypothetical protein